MATTNAHEAAHRTATPDAYELRRQLRGLSHDFGATFMMLQSSWKQMKKLLDQTDRPDALARQVRETDACMKESRRFMDDLVRLSTEGQVDWEAEPVDVVGVAEELLVEQAELVRQHRVKVQVRPGLPVVWCNRGRLKDVLLNLLRNAIRHGGDPAGPHVIIEPAGLQTDANSADGSMAGIRVWDNGPSIDPQKAAEIFLPGRRLDGAGEGTGWGLAIVRSTVERFGGRVEWETDCPSGTAFRVTLPIASPDADNQPAEPPGVEPGREWTLQLERGHRGQPRPHRHGTRHSRSGG